MSFLRRASITLCLSASGCHSDQSAKNVSMTDKNSTIAVVLGEERLQWKDAKRRPCLMGDVRKSAYYPEDVPASPSVMPIRLPKLFKTCDQNRDSYYQVYDPDILGNKASVDLDFRCGGMCGTGATFRLERSKNGWKVTDQLRRWES